jgi:hypothetical protein
VYGAATYIGQLNTLEKHPVYCVLVGVKRQSFAFTEMRYAYFSRESLQVYGSILLASWKAYLGYVSLGILMLSLWVVSRADAFQALRGWLSGLHGGIQVLLGLVSFLLLWTVVANARTFIANEATRFLRELRSRLARSAGALAREDKRPPILLLRSFKDDKILVENERYWGHRLLGIRDEQIRLEEVLAETLYPYGPLIALSNPVDMLPPLGAARENVADADWQRAVEQHMEQASGIVVIIGTTQSLRWEVNQILSKGHLEKCLFVFPPAYRSLKDKSHLLVNCLPALGHELGVRSAEEEMAVLADALVIGGMRRAEGLVIKADNGGRAMDYAEALRLSVLSTDMRSRFKGHHIAPGPVGDWGFLPNPPKGIAQR